jgi:hypothetical protein
MRCVLAITAAISIGPLIWKAPAAIAQDAPASKQQKKKTERSQQSLTGCVDQQDGQYVLINDQSRSLVANLEADGFPTEGFAKHVGHKVIVRGTSSPAGAERPVFRVRNVETVSETCGPQH